MKEKTPVTFYKEPEGILAVFSEEIHRHKEGIFYTCYGHQGQHALSQESYHGRLPKANLNEYRHLANELTAIGYYLDILNKDND